MFGSISPHRVFKSHQIIFCILCVINSKILGKNPNNKVVL